MNYKRGIAPLIIALLVALGVGVGAVGYKIYQDAGANYSYDSSKGAPSVPQANATNETMVSVPAETISSRNGQGQSSAATDSTSNWNIYSDGKGIALFKYPPNWVPRNFYYIGSRYPERYDPKEAPAGVDFVYLNGTDSKDMISLGIRVSMDPAKCGQYPREKATKCINSDSINFNDTNNTYGNVMWTESTNPEVLRVFDLMASTLTGHGSLGDSGGSDDYLVYNELKDANIPYSLIDEGMGQPVPRQGEVYLSDGQFSEMVYMGKSDQKNPTPNTPVNVSLVRKFSTADFNSDGITDSVAVINMDTGGSGTWSFLAVFLGDNRRQKMVAYISLNDDRVAVKSISVSNNVITLNLEGYFTGTRVEKYTFLGGKLTKVSSIKN